MLGRTLMVALSLPVLVAGSYGLLATTVPEWALTNALQAALHAALGIASSDIGLAIELESWLIGPAVRFTLAPAGVGLFLAGVLPRRGGKASPREAGSGDNSRKPNGVEKRVRKRAQK
ncbi:MAG: hypothetical protein VCC20_14405, partial [Myxococcota bacterium]